MELKGACSNLFFKPKLRGSASHYVSYSRAFWNEWSKQFDANPFESFILSKHALPTYFTIFHHLYFDDSLRSPLHRRGAWPSWISDSCRCIFNFGGILHFKIWKAHHCRLYHFTPISSLCYFQRWSYWPSWHISSNYISILFPVSWSSCIFVKILQATTANEGKPRGWITN